MLCFVLEAYAELRIFHTLLGGWPDGLVVGWVAGLVDNIVKSAQAWAMAGAGLDNLVKFIHQGKKKAGSLSARWDFFAL